MATPIRTIIPGRFYHMYNRGNHKEPIFHCAEDYERFLWRLRDAARQYGVEIAAYCLMPNHYHALVRQSEGGNLSKMMNSFTSSYVQWFNRRYQYPGHLFQGRYQIRPITNEIDLAHITRYIHRNPVNIKDIAEYEWSSYQAYLGKYDEYCCPDPVVQTLRHMGIYNYELFCQSVEPPGGY